jgi:hypothetical protein
MTTEAHGEAARKKRRSAQQLGAELKKLSDEIRWRNHRAVAEVRDAVHVVAGELEQTAATLNASAPVLATLLDEATVQGHLALLEAQDRLTLLDELVRTALRGASSSPSFIGETARLKLALAKLEATDLFEEKRRLLKEERKKLEATTAQALKELDVRVEEITSRTQAGEREEAERVRSQGRAPKLD